MMAQNYVKALEMAFFDTSNLTGGYDLLRVLPVPCAIIRFINNSSVDVGVSYDGLAIQDFLRLDSELVFNFQTNSQPSGKMALMKKGTHIYLIGQPGKGLVYITGYYQDY
jgi:hypothetical protein